MKAVSEERERYTRAVCWAYALSVEVYPRLSSNHRRIAEAIIQQFQPARQLDFSEDEIEQVLQIVQQPAIMHQCQHYELPSSKEDFFQPIGEELQFRIKYKHKQLLGGLELPEPIAAKHKDLSEVG